MKQYLLSIYQPDGDAPSRETLEPIMRKLETNRPRRVPCTTTGCGGRPHQRGGAGLRRGDRPNREHDRAPLSPAQASGAHRPGRHRSRDC